MHFHRKWSNCLLFLWKRVYEDTFKLFHDPLGGDQFGGYWDPALKAHRPFKALAGYSSIPCPKARTESSSRRPWTNIYCEQDEPKSKDVVVLNEQAILSEIERMGGGIIKSIITRE